MPSILSIEVFVDTKRDSISGEALFEGDYQGVGSAFNTGDRVKAITEVKGGLRGTETALRFNYQPASSGLDLFDKIVWENPPIPEVSARWQQERPMILSRIALAQGDPR